MTHDIIKKLTQYEFDAAQIRRDVLSIVKEHSALTQIGLTHSTRELSDADKLTESTGSIFDFNYGVFKFKETDFSVFNERYRDTYLYHMYNTLPSIGRFRIMIMNGPCCYTVHRDLSMRYHYAIDTNPNCLFIFPDFSQTIHIPSDNALYLVNTRHRHTFVNGSRATRIHLVLDDLSTLAR